MENSVLVTGASGFVGSNLIRKLIEKKYSVFLLLRKNSNTWRINDILSKTEVFESDLQDILVLKKIFQKVKPKYIFHLATYGAYSTQNDLEKCVETNIVGLKNLLEASKDLNYKGFINTGSSSEYGYKTKRMKETDHLEPESFYATTKASATLVAQTFAKLFKKNIISFRLFSVYGPYEESMRLVPTAIKAALSDEVFNLTPGKIRRDFIYIDDVVNAYFAAMNKKLGGEIFNIGSGKQYSNDQVVKIINSLSGRKMKIVKNGFNPRSWDTSFWVADTTKAKEKLKWQSRISLSEGLERDFKWFKKNLRLYNV